MTRKKRNPFRECALCNTTQAIEEHHIFGGPYRQKSTKYDMVIDLCSNCHREGKYAVHKTREIDLKLKRDAQRRFEEKRTREEFMRIFGKNYLD